MRALVRRRLEAELHHVVTQLRGGSPRTLTKAELRALVARYDAALARLKGQDYGRCAQCGHPISATRLKLMPAVATCAHCQHAIDAA